MCSSDLRDRHDRRRHQAADADRSEGDTREPVGERVQDERRDREIRNSASRSEPIGYSKPDSKLVFDRLSSVDLKMNLRTYRDRKTATPGGPL